ncbi:S-layer homology domain-containing protein [Pelotomaculum isophthalicicum JI]|uniref:S-layer homology domain-containing protein n=1 Tax=Pelotomaculum isophthalicicum JI TaxID=947010 RepID=A0A9X4H0Y4_9FIRM|nr:S-layer homology domain-containing protein [Pelotomaculum isophthalicicum]MDF9407671.1 S-layer homology domain-containing protein [Pelotomaculum isophthalicicum JI]
MVRFPTRGEKQYKFVFCAFLLVLGVFAFGLKPAIAVETSIQQMGEPAVQAVKTDFRDLDNDKQLLPSVHYLAAKGIINGFPDGTFRPADSLTRAEAAKILVLTKGLPEQSGGQPVFSDVPTGHWAFGTIQAAEKAGLLYGYEDGTSKPEEPVTRAEAIALLLRISGGTLTYKNVDIADNVTGLTPGTSYSFTIEARDAAGNLSSDGPAIEVTTTSLPDTQAPVWAIGGALLPSNITENGLTLNWFGATDNALVTGYELYKDGVQFDSVSGSTYSYTVAGLAPDTSYEFSVKALDGAGNRSSELTTTVTTAKTSDNQAPTWADGVITSSNITSNSVTLTWSGAADNVAVTGYEL